MPILAILLLSHLSAARRSETPAPTGLSFRTVSVLGFVAEHSPVAGLEGGGDSDLHQAIAYLNRRIARSH